MAPPTETARRVSYVPQAFGWLLVLASCGNSPPQLATTAAPASTEPPGPPCALAPENGFATGSPHAPPSANVLRPLFRWLPPADVAAAPVTYEVEVDDSCSITTSASCDFASPEASATGIASDRWRPETDLPTRLEPPVGRRYFWRVRACRGAACSGWAPTRYLDVGRVRTDLNGDGYGDAVVSAFGAALSRIPSGRVFVYLGGPAGPSLVPDVELVDPSRAPHTGFGDSAAVAGDVDADGFADLVVGAWNTDDTTHIRSGSAWLYLGRAAVDSWTGGRELAPPERFGDAQFGDSVAAAGDVNGDGYADLLVGASRGGADGAGRAYLFLGGTPGPGTELADPAGRPDAGFGRSVASAGDLDHDGYADIIVGAPGGGNAFVFAGAAAGIATTPLATLAGGEPERGGFGHEVTGAGDVDGDGDADLLVGVKYAGQAVAFAGGPEGPATTPSVTLDDPAPAAMMPTFGEVIAPLGDIDGDGDADVALGSRTAARDAGLVFVYQGGPTGLPADHSAMLECPADTAGAMFGWAVVPTDDADGDGFGDFVVTAPRRSDADGAIAFFYAGGDDGVATTSTATLQAGGGLSSFSSHSVALTSQPARGHLMGSEHGDAYSIGSVQPPTMLYEVEFVDLAVHGSLSEAAVLRRLTQARTDVKACLRSAFDARGSTGQVTLQLNLSADGGVIGFEQTGDTTGDEELATCVRDLIRRLSFARADGLSSCTVTVDLKVLGPGGVPATRPAPEPPAAPTSGTP